MKYTSENLLFNIFHTACIQVSSRVSVNSCYHKHFLVERKREGQILNISNFDWEIFRLITFFYAGLSKNGSEVTLRPKTTAKFINDF